MLDTDIDSLDHDSALRFVSEFLAALKQARRERAVAEEELEHWAHRVKLAGSRGEPVLRKSAEQHVTELRERAGRLAGEEQALKARAAALERKLRSLPEPQAQAALDELKRSLG